MLARAYRLAASICEEIGENKISEEIELLEHGIERLPGGYYNALAGQLATSYIRQAEVTGNSSYQEKALQTYQKMEDNGNTTLEVRLNIAMLQYQLRDFTDAMETLQALKTDYPKDYRVYKWLAFVQGEIDLKMVRPIPNHLNTIQRRLNCTVLYRPPVCMTPRWMS